MFKDRNRSLVVLTANTLWREPPRMRHHVAIQLSKNYNVIFCELNQQGFPRIEFLDGNLAILKVGLYLPGLSRIRFISRLFDKLQCLIISYFAVKNKSKIHILMNFKFDFHSIFEDKNFHLKYLFINDDFVNMNSRDTTFQRNLKQNDLNYSVKSSDRVFVSSQPLANDVSNGITSISVIHSGHDFVAGKEIKHNENEITKVCFMGYIHEKLQWSWLLKLAQHPKISIELIGPVECKKSAKVLASYENVVFRGALVGSELQEHMSEYDVFIMPYTIEPVNSKATVPAKLFQYMACGAPIVSSYLENLIDLPDDFVYFANNESEFVSLIHTAKIRDNETLRKKRIEFAMNHRWERRGEDMHAIILGDLRTKIMTCNLEFKDK
jgi:glycosyltransferase involved in cell wall biosynthesis